MTFHAALQAGDEVLVVFDQDGERTSLVATVASANDDTMTVRLAAPFGLPRGAPATVLAGSGELSRYASVTRAARNGTELAIAHGAWRRILNRRASPRYPVLIEVVLESEGFRESGRIVDLSDRGAAIEVSHWERLTFDLELPGLRIPCRAVAIEPLQMMDVVHATFTGAATDSAGVISGLVEQARLEFTAGQRKLARGNSKRPEWATSTAGIA